MNEQKSSPESIYSLNEEAQDYGLPTADDQDFCIVISQLVTN